MELSRKDRPKLHELPVTKQTKWKPPRWYPLISPKLHAIRDPCSPARSRPPPPSISLTDERRFCVCLSADRAGPIIDSPPSSFFLSAKTDAGKLSPRRIKVQQHFPRGCVPRGLSFPQPGLRMPVLSFPDGLEKWPTDCESARCLLTPGSLVAEEGRAEKRNRRVMARRDPRRCQVRSDFAMFPATCYIPLLGALH